MEVNGSLEVTDLASLTHGDDLAVDLNAELSELFSNLSSTDRAVEVTGSGNLSGDDKLNILQSLSTLLSLSLQSGELSRLLLEVLGELLAGTCRCDDTLACRDQIVTAVAVLNLYDIVLVSKSDNIFLYRSCIQVR